jgi:hypothetical protein
MVYNTQNYLRCWTLSMHNLLGPLGLSEMLHSLVFAIMKMDKAQNPVIVADFCLSLMFITKQ